MPNRDRFPRGRRAIEVLADRVVDTKPTVLDQQHDARGDELFADRGDFEDRVRRRRLLQLDVGKAVSSPRATESICLARI